MNSAHLKYAISFLTGIGTSAFAIILPLYVKDLGGTDATVSLVIAAGFAASMLTYAAAGRYSDLYATRKIVILAGLLLTALTLALHYFAVNIVSLFFVRFLYGLASGIFAAPLIAYTASGDDYKKNMSVFYGFGSLGMAVAFFLATPLLKYFKFTEISLMLAVPILLSFALAFKIQKEKISRVKVPLIPVQLIKRNLAVYLAFFIRHVCAQAMFPFLPIFALELGAPLLIVGPLLALNPFVQFFVMSSIPKIKTSSRNIFRAGLILSTAMLFGVALSPSYQFLLIPMILVGFAWSFLSVGANLVLVEENVEKATVSGLFWSAASFALIIGPLLGGALATLFNLRIMILIISVLSLLALGIDKFLKK